MKKHPVDDLFRRRLDGLERTPSANAWQRIEERNTSRKKSGWIWYAAASMLVGVLAGYLILSNRQEQHVEDRVAVKRKPHQQEAKQLPGISESVIAQLPESELNAPERESGKMETAAKSNHNAIQQSGKNHSTEALTEVAKQEPVESGQLDIQIKPAEMIEKPTIAEVRPKLAEPTISQSMQAEPEPTRTIVVTVETDEPEAQPRVSKFTRVFRQLKNARAGERVDWEEVGFNPRDLFAKADDRFKQKEEKPQGKDQTSRQHQTFN